MQIFKIVQWLDEAREHRGALFQMSAYEKQTSNGKWSWESVITGFGRRLYALLVAIVWKKLPEEVQMGSACEFKERLEDAWWSMLEEDSVRVIPLRLRRALFALSLRSRSLVGVTIHYDEDEEEG